MIDEKSRTAARVALTNYLRAKNLRKTPERFAILDKVCGMSRHFNIDALYLAIEEDGFHLSRATLYNTMELFISCGIVRSHRFGTHPAQYELSVGRSNHLHLICQQCGKIKEVKNNDMERFMAAQRYSAFTPQYFSLYVYGICSTCSRKNKRSDSDDITNNNNITLSY